MDHRSWTHENYNGYPNTLKYLFGESFETLSIKRLYTDFVPLSNLEEKI